MMPEMLWDLCTQGVIVMERMKGVPISQIDRLREAGVDIPKLARDGVTIFFTQVFRDGFFHADMHPGNIQVSVAPATFGRYIALDFGIVGTLTEFDKEYLAQNFIAFFRRDYKRVAELHVESGWVPPETRVDALEGAIRAVCEPHFDRPLKDISLGQVLLRLFQTSRRFNVEIQPQLVLLQKTLLNIEGLGRELDPDLDLWNTAKPFLERWMNDQVGWRGLVERLQERGAALRAAAARTAAPGAPGAAARPRAATTARAGGAARRAAAHQPLAARGADSAVGSDRLLPLGCRLTECSCSCAGQACSSRSDQPASGRPASAGLLAALKLVKMRVCTRRMSCGRRRARSCASGPAAPRKIDLVLGHVLASRTSARPRSGWRRTPCSSATHAPRGAGCS